MAKNNLNIGFIGAGNMAEAMVGALIQSETVDASRITVCDISRERLDLFQNRFGVQTVSDSVSLFQLSDIVVLSVKPQVMMTVLKEIEPCRFLPDTKKRCVISIAAGVRLEKLESVFYNQVAEEMRNKLALIRVMPNTPCLAFSGMSVMSANPYATSEDIEITRAMLASMGSVMELPEADLDAVTAMSGSGPAYVFYFLEAMIEAGKRLHLDENTATVLACETFKGALALMDMTGESPETLRRKVTSPGGTTEAAIRALDQADVQEVFIDAIRAAKERSVALSGSA